jgi:YVTN family beta-propeller protein
MPVGVNPIYAAINPAGTRVYVTADHSNDVSVIDTTTNTVVATVGVGVAPQGVAVHPSGARVYVANHGSNDVSVIDTATNTVIATAGVGDQPAGVAINSAGTHAYVANYASNNVSVIDTAANTVVATVPVGTQPITVAFAARPPNSAPVASCQDVIVSAGSDCSAFASIDNGSFDPDGDSITLIQEPPGPYPIGMTSVTLTVTDSGGASSQCMAIVTVNDDQSPSITDTAVDKPALWPPNHKMVDVTVSYSSSDNCGAITCWLSVTSNEPEDGTGDGDTAPDWEVIDAHHVRLRAERAGTGNGRIYTITITCTDSTGNSSTQTVTVSVPKNQS